MSDSIVTYNNQTGSQTVYVINFLYLDSADVVCELDGVAVSTSEYSVSGSNVTFNTAPVGDLVIKRITPIGTKKVTFPASAPIRSADMNLQDNQFQYALQENRDIINYLLTLYDPFDGTFDGRDVSTDGAILDGLNTGDDAAVRNSDFSGIGFMVKTAENTFEPRTLVGGSGFTFQDGAGTVGDPVLVFDTAADASLVAQGGGAKGIDVFKTATAAGIRAVIGEGSTQDPAKFGLPNLAALTAIAKSTLTDGDAATIAGYSSINDGGAGSWFWDENSTDTDNGVTVVAADEGGDGRWKRPGPVWPECAGCDASAADNTTALQRLADANVNVIGSGRANAYAHATAITLPAGFNARWQDVWTDISGNESAMSSITGTGADFTSPVNLTANAAAGARTLTVASGDESDFQEGTIALLHQKKNWAADRLDRGMNSDWAVCEYPNDGSIRLATGVRLPFTTGDATIAISGITKANPGVITATSHGLTIGEIYEVDVTSVGGMTELNGTSINVEVVNANTLNIVTAGGSNVATDLEDITFSGLSGHFVSGETVNFAPSSAVGTITSISNSGGTMSIRLTSGTATDADGMTGATSGATADVDTIASEYTAYTSGGNLAYAAATVRAWQSVFSPKFYNCGVIGNPQWGQVGFDFTRAYQAEIFNCTGVNLRERLLRLKVDVDTRAGNNTAELSQVIDQGITAITAAKPPVITSTAHGFEDGARIKFSGIGGMTELNGNTYYVNRIDANSYSLENSAGDPTDGTGFTAFTSGGIAEIDFGSRYMMAPNGGYGGLYGEGKGVGIRHVVAYGASGSGSGNMPSYIIQRNCRFGDTVALDSIASPWDSHGGACDIAFGNLTAQMRRGDGEDAFTIQGCRVTFGDVQITGNRSIGLYIQNLGYGDETPEDSEDGRPNYVRGGHVDISDAGSQQTDETNSILRAVNLGKAGGVLHEITLASFGGTGEEGMYFEPRNGDIGRIVINGGTVIARTAEALILEGDGTYRINKSVFNGMHLENSDGADYTVDIDGGTWFTDIDTGMGAWVVFNDCHIENTADREAVNATGALVEFNRTPVIGNSNNNRVIEADDDCIIGINGVYHMNASVVSNEIKVLPNAVVTVDTSGGVETVNKAVFPSWFGYYSGTHNPTYGQHQAYRLSLRPSSGNNLIITHSTGTAGGFFGPFDGETVELTDSDGIIDCIWNEIPSNERWSIISVNAPDNLNLSVTDGAYKIAGDTVLTRNSLNMWDGSSYDQVIGPRVVDADLAAVTLGNTDSEIGNLSFSATPTQAECEALRDKCEEVADDLRNIHTLLEALRGVADTHGFGKES